MPAKRRMQITISKEQEQHVRRLREQENFNFSGWIRNQIDQNLRGGFL